MEKLENLEKDFNKMGNIEGELEALFAICIVNYRDNKDLKKFEDIFKIINELKGDKEKEEFISLFQSKVKYKYLKYKIKNENILDNDLSELEKILFYFKNYNCFS